MGDNNKTPHPEPRAALITPSASPPLSRPSISRHHRIPDQASPTKRPRLSSAPRQHASSSSSTLVEPIDYHAELKKSEKRMLDVWDSLAERYSRPMREDDIVDIITGKVVKDRGVLRGLQTQPFGAFAGEDVEDEVEVDEEEDDVDELDSFANSEIRGIGLEKKTGEVTPIAEEDARALDLKEFLEAEQRRRELYGSEVDEADGSIYESLVEEDLTEETRLSEPVAGINEISNGGQTVHPRPEILYVDSGSDDELGGWDDLGEASALYRIHKTEDSDSEVEFIDRTDQTSPKVPLICSTSPELASRRGNDASSYKIQLQTPPQSHASSHPSTTPDDHILPPSSPPRSSSPFSSQYDTSPIKSKEITKGISEHKRAPPSSRPMAVSPQPIPRLDLAKASAGKPKRTSKAVPSCARSPAKKPSLSNFVSSTRLTEKTSTRTTSVEVVITRRTPFQDSPQSQPATSKNDKPEKKLHISAKAKGKQKAISSDEQAEYFVTEDPHSRPPSPPIVNTRQGASTSIRSRSRRPSVSSELAPQESRLAQPPLPDRAPTSSRKTKPPPLPAFPVPTSGKKRKRVASAMDTPETLKAVSSEPLARQRRSRSRNTSPSQSSRHPSDAESAESKIVKEEVKLKEKRKIDSRRRSRTPDPESDASQYQEEGNIWHQRHSSRAPSHFTEPYYSYPQPPYPPTHTHPPPMYTPLHNPHAQHIIACAMQQILALGGPTWGPPPHSTRGSTPFTPTHHRHHLSDRSAPMYSTPMHHPHPYPYSYNPMMSGATLPPESPEVPSSSPGMSASGAPRRKSLVNRSRSRGRTVSFREEASDIDESDASDSRGEGEWRFEERQAGSATARGSASGSHNQRRGKARAESLCSESDVAPESAPEPQIDKRGRGRPSTRHQTPGPAQHASKTRLNDFTGHRSKSRA